MLDSPLKCVREFLSLRLVPGKRLLLALSGGGDSLALLYLLLDCRQFFSFDLHLAHVDHAWREESLEEASSLSRLSQHLQLPFHLKRLEPLSGCNLEDRYREKRYHFFSQLQEKWNFQALILAHHGDDQAETLLKRICEGARLGALGGLKFESRRKNLTLWRPLLSIWKKELFAYLNKREIPFFHDRLNDDPTYLRPRMRLHMFPDFERHFGKSVKRNFSRFAFLFQEIATYLEEKKKSIEAELIVGPFGECLEMPSSFSPLEVRFFLEETARRCGAHLSHSSCEALLRLIQRKASKGLIYANPLTFVINYQCLFILRGDFPPFSEDTWKVKSGIVNWRDFWRGFCPAAQKERRILYLRDLKPCMRKKLKKWYAKHRVPPFFHDKAPIFVSRKKMVSECLTGAMMPIANQESIDASWTK